jgi:hypothetical protein
VTGHGAQAPLRGDRPTPPLLRERRHWYADPPTGRTLVRQADTRTEAVDRLLATTPGPLWGDPADTVVHDLSDS